MYVHLKKSLQRCTYLDEYWWYLTYFSIFIELKMCSYSWQIVKHFKILFKLIILVWLLNCNSENGDYEHWKMIIISSYINNIDLQLYYTNSVYCLLLINILNCLFWYYSKVIYFIELAQNHSDPNTLVSLSNSMHFYNVLSKPTIIQEA